MRYFSTCQVFKLQWLAMLMAGAAPAFAEPPPDANQNTPEAVALPWELYDTNEDGYIGADEAAAQGMSTRTFEGLDIDRNGQLNRDEFAKAPRIR